MRGCPRGSRPSPSRFSNGTSRHTAPFRAPTPPPPRSAGGQSCRHPRPEEPEGALFILVQDGAHGLFFHFPRVSIARADDISFDAETLAGLPVPARARPEQDVPGHHPRLAVRPAGLITSSAPDH
ncbi:phage tail tube protein [Streptomyces malaysiensis]